MGPRRNSAIPWSAPPVDNGQRPRERPAGSEMKLVLYVRRDCHLCAEMHRDLVEIGARHPFSVELVDIDADADLVLRYGHKVPVLVGADEEICHYFLDEQQLVDFLSRAP